MGLLLGGRGRQGFTAQAGDGGASGTTATQHGVRSIGGPPVDFPGFVCDLIEGVVSAIVDAMIKQVEVYGRLANDVTKRVGHFKSGPMVGRGHSAGSAHVRERPGVASLDQRPMTVADMISAWLVNRFSQL